MKLNPMTPFIAAYQGIFVNGMWPSWASLFPSAVLAAVLCLLALVLFRRRSGEIVDEL